MLQQQQIHQNSGPPSDAEMILNNLVTPQSMDLVDDRIEKLSLKQKKEAKHVLVNALQGLIQRLDVNSSVVSEDAVTSNKSHRSAAS